MLHVEIEDDLALKLLQRADALGLHWQVVANGMLRALLQAPTPSVGKPIREQSKNKAFEERILLPQDWCEYKISQNVDVDRPGLYEWTIEGCGSYMGKYGRITRPTREYQRNVQNLLNGKKYRLGKPTKFRRIHRELGAAFLSGRTITLTILENAEGLELLQREQELIDERGTLNGHKKGTRS